MKASSGSGLWATRMRRLATGVGECVCGGVDIGIGMKPSSALDPSRRSDPARRGSERRLEREMDLPVERAVPLAEPVVDPDEAEPGLEPDPRPVAEAEDALLLPGDGEHRALGRDVAHVHEADQPRAVGPEEIVLLEL